MKYATPPRKKLFFRLVRESNCFSPYHLIVEKIMVSPNKTAIIFILLTAFCWNNSAYSRQNIVIGSASVRYEFVERKYDVNDDEVATEVTIPMDQNTGTSTSEEESVEVAELGPNETDDGDTSRLIISPRISVSSRGINDFLEFTYAPSFPFLTFDESGSGDNVGHNFNLLAEKSFTKNWSFQVSDNYYYGYDSLEDAALSNSAIIPGTDETKDVQTVGAEQADGTGQSLREQNERREYWRNTLNIATDYTFAQDTVVGLGYAFGVLRNLSDDVGGVEDYDRHAGSGQLSYRFNRSWQVETNAGYVRGYYDSSVITSIQPEIIQVEVEDEIKNTDENATDEEEPEIEYEEQTVYNQSEQEYSDDLEEYNFLFQVNYDRRTRDRFFSLYSYNATDYESPLREDAAIHNITFGWSHDFSRALHMTLSGGPSSVNFEKSITDTGYNAFAGLIWDFQHASLTANSSYGYEINIFDRDRTGLSQPWRSTLGYSYQFSPRLSLSLSTGYTRSDNEEPIATIVLLDLEGEDTATDDVSTYTDESYNAGLALSYNFLRWYTVSASYRYADYQSENDLDYDEHRVYLTLSASKELFRW